MTNPSKTEIVFIIDRSGSMSTIKTDMEGGFRSFIADQRKLPGECVVSLYQFDTLYEPVFENVDVQKVPEYTLDPRGMTALLDAIGRTINDVGSRLSKLSEDERPGKVVVVIITDGQENSSREFTSERVKDMIEHQRSKFSWQFAFLGANIDSFSVGASLGINAASTMDYAASSAGTQAMYGTLARSIGSYRTTSSTSLSFDDSDDKNQ